MAITKEDLRRQVLESPRQFRTRQELWHYYLSIVRPGDVCAEFGVWRGASINYMAKVRPCNTFHGFDSFKGLPEDWIKNHPAGTFSVPDPEKLKWAPNVQIHPGEFKATIKDFKKKHAEDFDKLRLVHIDCDLGTSAETVLTELFTPLTKNRAWLLFDEFYNYDGYENHEFAAFLDFVNTWQLRFHIEARNCRHQQVLIRIL